MYNHYSTQDLQERTIKAVADAEIFGVSVFVESDPEWCGADMYIDPTDEAGISIFREFSLKMAEHYRKLSS
jgi:hypothetical protein